MADSVKLTGRQRDHLELLQDGDLHHVIKAVSSHSCYGALVAKGLAEKEINRATYHTTKYRITPSGRAHLASKGE
jgi:hypothetical protein